MNFDDALKTAWQGETRHGEPTDLTRRVHRQRQRHRLKRTLEVTLTLLAVLLFGHALLGGGTRPSHWLLLPFYLVYLPMAWAFILRAPRPSRADVTETAHVYAHLRLSQLRTTLRDLYLARAAAWSLLAYAVVANAGVLAFGDHAWRDPGLLLAGVATVWLGITLWFTRTRRRSALREYRVMKRLAGA